MEYIIGQIVEAHFGSLKKGKVVHVQSNCFVCEFARPIDGALAYGAYRYGTYYRCHMPIDISGNKDMLITRLPKPRK